MIFVTGGTGLVGTYLLYYLALKGEKIIALKRESSNTSRVKQIFSYYADNYETLFRQIQWVEGDITDYESLLEIISKDAIVYHCAAFVSFNPKDKKQIFQQNVIGTRNIVNACLENEAKKICHVSSVAALGHEKINGTITEESKRDTEIFQTGYSKSKYNSELEVWRGVHEGLHAVIVNPSIILGVGNWDSGSSSIFKNVYHGFRFYTNGSTGFVDARDVAQTMIKLTESEISGERYIVTSENIRYKDIFSHIARSFNKKEPDIYVGKLLSSIVWRISSAVSFLTGGPPQITKETAKASHENNSFSNKKIVDKLNYKFIPVDDTIQHITEIFQKSSMKK